MNDLLKQFSDKARKEVPPNLSVDDWIDKYNQLYAGYLIELIESFIEDSEGDIDFVRFLIDTKLKGGI